MRKIIFLFLSCILYSCSGLFPAKNGVFRIRRVVETSTYSNYLISTLNNNGGIWFKDSVGKYHVGDTVYITDERPSN